MDDVEEAGEWCWCDGWWGAILLAAARRRSAIREGGFIAICFSFFFNSFFPFGSSPSANSLAVLAGLGWLAVLATDSVLTSVKR